MYNSTNAAELIETKEFFPYFLKVMKSDKPF